MVGKILFLSGAFVVALAAVAPVVRAGATDDACRKAPTRACVLDAAVGAADSLPQPYARANALAVTAAAEQRAGFAERAAATMARAAEAAKLIPADFEFGSKLPGLAAMCAEMGDAAAAIELAR